jgi:hypothetical protein
VAIPSKTDHDESEGLHQVRDSGELTGGMHCLEKTQ